MGPESHSAMLPKEMTGSGVRTTQKWQKESGAGGGREGWGWRIGRKLLLCMARKNNIFLSSHEIWDSAKDCSVYPSVKSPDILIQIQPAFIQCVRISFLTSFTSSTNKKTMAQGLKKWIARPSEKIINLWMTQDMMDSDLSAKRVLSTF